MSSNDVTRDELPTGSGAAEVTPIPAASTIVLRGAPYEVLLMRRHQASSFAPGAWVFPGGSLDEGDTRLAGAAGDELEPFRICALRELFEETGIWPGVPPRAAAQVREDLLSGRLSFADIARDVPLMTADLVLTARWITPVGMEKRFDTRFFLLPVPEETEATAEQREGVEVMWIRPEEALERHRAGSLPMVFPTRKNLEQISGFACATELLDARRGREVPVTLPVLIVEGDRHRIILPEAEGE